MKPTQAQINKWESIDRQIQALDHLTRANRHRLQAFTIANDFGREKGLEPIVWTGDSPFDQGLRLKKANFRLLRARQGVNSEELGLQFFKDGEVSILAPPHYTADQIKYWQGGDFEGIILIVAGITIVAGVIGMIALLKSQNNDLKEKVNWLNGQLDSKYCADPNSQLCSDWIDRKEVSGYNKHIGIAERLEDTAKKIGGAVVKGAKWGLILAIPLLAWIFLGGKKKSNA